jgi:hypothetical protein
VMGEQISIASEMISMGMDPLVSMDHHLASMGVSTMERHTRIQCNPTRLHTRCLHLPPDIHTNVMTTLSSQMQRDLEVQPSMLWLLLRVSPPSSTTQLFCSGTQPAPEALPVTPEHRRHVSPPRPYLTAKREATDVATRAIHS